MRDKRNREIKLGSRVHVRRRPTYLLGPDYRNSDGKHALPAFSGRVVRLDSDEVVTIRDFDGGQWRTVRGSDVTVQYGHSQASRVDALFTKEEKPRKREVVTDVKRVVAGAKKEKKKVAKKRRKVRRSKRTSQKRKE